MLQIPYFEKRVRTPTLIQLELAECGAACLGILLRHYGRVVPLTELREACGVSRDGSTASNLIRAATRYGLEARGVSCGLEALREIPCPYIVFWKFNHFLVVEGFSRNGVYLNDPAGGHRRITHTEFEHGFTGIVLTTKPGPDFEPGGRARATCRSLIDRLRGHGGTFLFCLLVGLLLAVPGVVLPACTAAFVDGVVIDGRSEWVRPLLLIMAAAILLQCVLKMLQLQYLRSLGIALAARLSGRFVWHLLQLPTSFYAQRFPGEIASRTQLNERIAQVVTGRLATVVIDVVTLGAYAVVMLHYDMTLACIGMGLAGCNFVALRWVARHRVEANLLMAQEEGKAASTAIAGLQCIESLKASGLETAWFGRWSGHFAKACNARQRLESSSLILGVLPSFLQAAATALILLLGSLRVMQGEMSIGTMIAFQSLMAAFLAPIGLLVHFGGTMQEMHGDLARLDDVLENPAGERIDVDSGEKSSDRMPMRLAGHIQVHGLTFGYSPLDEPIVDNFSAVVEPGCWLGIVGPSGSGKSTIAKLLSGLHRPWSGTICFDGLSRERLSGAVLVNSIGVVDQELLLLEGTIRDNLTLWDPTIPEDALVRACRDALIHDEILSLPGGYDAWLLEGGINLSGGQRQRLELARALLHDPTVLILDEATSALDAETEHRINQNLRRRGCTCVVVAHRPSTIQACDDVVMLERGRVVELGSFDALLDRQGNFAQLLTSSAMSEPCQV